MLMNDYTLNLASLIERGCKENNIKIKVKKNVIGSNPFLPISIIEVIPRGIK